MHYELKVMDDGRVLYLRVIDTPPFEEAQALNHSVSADIARRDISRMIVDYRDMERSDFDATISRALLVQMDRLLGQLGRVPPSVFKMALLSQEGTFGHGIARMTIGNAYGLRVLSLRHFIDCVQARRWLDASGGTS